MQALAEAAAPDHGEQNDDQSDDDQSTLVLPGRGPGDDADIANPLDVASGESSDGEEEGEQEENTDDEDRNGNTSHGFNLEVLKVPLLPPTPPSSENEDEDG